MESILLVFDDDRLNLRSIGRVLSGIFDRLLLAQTARQAEELLSTHPITHLLCDRCVAEHLNGEEFIRQWRQRWPSIQYAALMTGGEVGLPVEFSMVDAVFRKPFEPTKLRAELTEVKNQGQRSDQSTSPAY